MPGVEPRGTSGEPPASWALVPRASELDPRHPRILKTSRIQLGPEIECQHDLSKYRAHHVSMHVGQSVLPSLELKGEARVLNSQAVEDRGVQIVDVHGIPRHIVTEVVGLTVRDASTNAAAG